MLRFLKFFFKLLSVLSLAVYVSLFFIKIPLPDKSKLELSKMFHEPEQQNLSPEKFDKKIKGYNYEIEKVAKYKITGLVVEQYTSDNWLDLTHKNDPANTRDLCIIWGGNLDPEIYKKVKFDHGEFTCFVSWSDSNTLFHLNALSNNHLIPENEYISSQIKNVKVGDQVTVTGYLANYRVTDSKGSLTGERRTSTVRDDNGNGACEVLYTTDIEIIKTSNPWFFIARDYLPYVFGASVLINLLFIAL